MAAEPVVSFALHQQLEDTDSIVDPGEFRAAIEIVYAELCAFIEARSTPRPLRRTPPALSPPGGIRRTWPGYVGSVFRTEWLYFRRRWLRRRVFALPPTVAPAAAPEPEPRPEPLPLPAADLEPGRVRLIADFRPLNQFLEPVPRLRQQTWDI